MNILSQSNWENKFLYSNCPQLFFMHRVPYGNYENIGLSISKVPISCEFARKVF